MDLAGYIIFFSSWLILHYAAQLDIVQRFTSIFKKYILMSYCIYPKTETFKEKVSKALYEGDDVNNVNWQDINLRISGIKDEVKPLVDIMRQYGSDFFLDQIDYLVISKMGVEIIKITNKPNRIHPGQTNSIDRSLFLEITQARANIWLFATFSEILIAFVMTFAYENRSQIASTLQS